MSPRRHIHTTDIFGREEIKIHYSQGESAELIQRKVGSVCGVSNCTGTNKEMK